MASARALSRSSILVCLVLIIAGQILSSSLVEQFFYLSIVNNQLLVILGIPLLFAWRGQVNWHELFPFSSPPLKFWSWTLVLAICADTLLEYLVWLSEKLLPLPETVAMRFDELLSINSFEDFLLKVFFLCLLPAFAEEICFRGFFQGALSKHYGKLIALGITALIFAFLHGNTWYFHLYLLLGVWFGGLRILSASLLPSIFCHFINNSWTLGLNAAQLAAPFFPAQPALDIALFVGAFAGGLFALRKLWLFSKDFPRIKL